VNPTLQVSGSPRIVVALLFDGFELLDVFGPLEAWGMLSVETKRWRLVTTSARAGAVASAQGPSAVAECGLAGCPRADVLLVPGGIGTRRAVGDERLLEWLQARAAAADVISSVCTGSALLARAGLLDGLRATTNKFAFAWVAEQGPSVHWVREARWVEDGRFFTSAGVSAGIDMTLAVIAKLEGSARAEEIAVRMEYEWHRDAHWDPFARIHGLV
jgi:transcriptional regulator GlxA family with amidase domain